MARLRFCSTTTGWPAETSASKASRRGGIVIANAPLRRAAASISGGKLPMRTGTEPRAESRAGCYTVCPLPGLPDRTDEREYMGEAKQVRDDQHDNDYPE